jgi:GNAT superfamily N-acetyltransferase
MAALDSALGNIAPDRNFASTRVVGIAGDDEIDRAIDTLADAFGGDPVARWMDADPGQYRLHAPRPFQAVGASSFEAAAAHRTTDGFGVALWLPPGVRGGDGALQSVIAASSAGSRQAEIAALFEQAEHHRPTEPHWYLPLIGVHPLHCGCGLGASLLQHRLRQCDRERLPAYLWSLNVRNVPLYRRHGFEITGVVQSGSSPPVFPMVRPPH